MAETHPYLSKRLIPKEGIDHRRAMIEKARAIEGVISLGRGDPDLKTPPHIIEAAKRALDEGYTGYSPWPGYLDLREAIATKLAKENSIDATAGEILVTVGAEEAVFLTMMAILDPGDEILVPEPRYTPYDMAVEMAGGKVLPVPTGFDGGFQIDPKEVERRITPATKALLVITPNNPTGQVLDQDRAAALARIATQHDLVIISDELYEKIVFEGIKNPSIASLPGMKERTITINGFSKTYCMTGWRVGYLHAPAQIVEAMIPLKYTITINAPSMCQRAALAALEGPQDCIEEFQGIYHERRNAVMNALAKMGVRHGPARGAFYVFADISQTGMTSFDFCQRLLDEQKVLVFPGTAFGAYGEGGIRISLLAPIENIEEAMDRMERFVGNKKV
jgi:aminotransferase